MAPKASPSTPFPAAGDALADVLSRLGRADALAAPYLDEATCGTLADCCAELAFRDARPVLGAPGREVHQDLELTTDIPEDSPLLALAMRFGTAKPPGGAVRDHKALGRRGPEEASGVLFGVRAKTPRLSTWRLFLFFPEFPPRISQATG